MKDIIPEIHEDAQETRKFEIEYKGNAARDRAWNDKILAQYTLERLRSNDWYRHHGINERGHVLQRLGDYGRSYMTKAALKSAFYGLLFWGMIDLIQYLLQR